MKRFELCDVIGREVIFFLKLRFQIECAMMEPAQVCVLLCWGCLACICLKDNYTFMHVVNLDPGGI